jgi:endonuclease YncB( thermonuclease family)
MAVFLSCVIGMTIGAVVADNTKTETKEKDDEIASLNDLPSQEVKRPDAPKVGVRQVLKVLSPDTVEIDEEGPVRLLGIDIRQTPGAKPTDQTASRAILESLVVGKSVDVQCDPETFDTDFRSEDGLLLVYLMSTDGILINTELVARGVAVADLSRTYTHKDELMIAERDARWNARGMWEVASKTATAPLPPSPGMPSVIVPAKPLQPGEMAVAPKPAPKSGDVLVTSDGRYHRQSCTLGKNGVPLSADEARQKHYLACPSCFVSPKVST